MAYTTARKPFPSVPNQEAPIAKPDRKPDTPYVTFFNALKEWARTLDLAVTQVTPPEALTSTTVGALPAAASNTGVRFMVTDANATTFNSVVAGGGANIVPVFSTGAAWRIG